VKLDVQTAGVAAPHLGLEHAPAVGHKRDERLAQPGEVARAEALEPLPDREAALVNRAFENLFRFRGAEF